MVLLWYCLYHTTTILLVSSPKYILKLFRIGQPCENPITTDSLQTPKLVHHRAASTNCALIELSQVPDCKSTRPSRLSYYYIPDSSFAWSHVGLCTRLVKLRPSVMFTGHFAIYFPLGQSSTSVNSDVSDILFRLMNQYNVTRHC